MMTKEQHIAYWLKSSEDDELSMQFLFNNGQYTHSLFFGHLFLEKICKALWIKNNPNNTPPFIHNLVRILNGIDTGLNEEDISFLNKLNEYQISGRYPDYIYSLKLQTTKEYTEYCINHIKQINECLRKKIS
jgi:HEPN domain-containing protein